MIAVDTNILVYAHREDSEWHAPALQTLLELVTSGQSWGIPWPCVHEFLAICTHPKIYVPATPMHIALESIEQWLSVPGCRKLSEGPGYFEQLTKLLTAGKVRGGMVHDARIAALCEHHGVKTLLTADRDFSRFPGISCVNPLVP